MNSLIILGSAIIIIGILIKYKIIEPAKAQDLMEYTIKEVAKYETKGIIKHEAVKLIGNSIGKTFTDEQVKSTYEKIDLGEIVDKVNLNEQLEISKSSLEARGFVEADLIKKQVVAGLEANYKFDWTKITRKKIK